MPAAVRAALLCAAAALFSRGTAHGLLTQPIYVVGNGWHAGLLVPAAALQQPLPALAQRFPHAKYYEVGWGDVGFYRARQVTVSLAMEAMFFSKGAVLHVVAVPPTTRIVESSDLVKLCLTPPQIQRMLALISDTFERDAVGAIRSAGPGIYGDSEFYAARGHYSALNTCNRWTASALQTAGVRITPRVSLTAGSVLRAAQQHGEACVGP